MKQLLAQLNMGSSPQVHMPVEKQICKHLLKKNNFIAVATIHGNEGSI